MTVIKRFSAFSFPYTLQTQRSIYVTSSGNTMKAYNHFMEIKLNWSVIRKLWVKFRLRLLHQKLNGLWMVWKLAKTEQELLWKITATLVTHPCYL